MKGNNHIPHLEDLVTMGQPDDAVRLLGYLWDYTSGKEVPEISVSLKWDGSPAFVMGRDPETNEFFIATKHAFLAKNQRLAHSVEEIHAQYPDVGLASKLVAIFDACKDMPWDTLPILQGDFLFSPDTLEPGELGKGAWSFRPNTIRYALRDEDPPLTLNNFKVGIALHTWYTDVQSGPWNLSIEHPGVFCAPTYFRQKVRYRPSVVKWYAETKTRVFKDLQSKQYSADTFDLWGKLALEQSKDTHLGKMVERYINHCVRVGYSPSGANFMLHGSKYFHTRREKVKSDLAVGSWDNHLLDFIRGVIRYERAWHEIFELHDAITGWKLAHLDRLNKNSPFRCTIDGYNRVGHEGFVVTELATGLRVKVVDREVFSRLNMIRERK